MTTIVTSDPKRGEQCKRRLNQLPENIEIWDSLQADANGATPTRNSIDSGVQCINV